MPRRVSGSLIAVSFSTRGALMPAWMVQHVAGMANVDGIDVDATSPLGVWLAARSGTSESPHIPIRTIWLPIEGVRAPRVQRLLDFTHAHQSDVPPLIVLTLSGAGASRDLARTFFQTADVVRDWNVALGLPATALRGGRPHLVQLAAVRRFAEEWDLAVALDLAGRFDPTWEAEAAISRIGNRLKLVRLSVAAPSRAAVGRDRVACRALHAAIDRVERLDIALSSSRSIPFPVTPRPTLTTASSSTSGPCAKASADTKIPLPVEATEYRVQAPVSC